MNVRSRLASAVGTSLVWTLKNIAHRNAASFPGKMALRIDPQIIAHLSSRAEEGSVVVVGTNGKTTVTNLLADSLEAAGKSVICNRTGANLGFGVASALLATKRAEWGVFESDELWLARVLPQLRPNYVVLLNLFRDQLDRMGEIEHVRDSIIGALTSSPETTLIYNCDDPLCQAIADGVDNASLAFGVEEEMGLAQNSVVDANMCQKCDAMLEYRWLQYGQLGSYLCPNCGFERRQPDIAATDVHLGAQKVSFVVHGEGIDGHLDAAIPGSYSVYNLLAVCAAASKCGVPFESVDAAVKAFDPENGRLQAYEFDGRHVLLNLAKNPTGFNQNLRIIESDTNPVAVAFFINDNRVDGKDVSWLWDVDFQELASKEGLKAFAGGIRRNDMQVRLKYAGIDADLVDGAEDFLARAQAWNPEADCYVISNYTSLWEVKAELDGLSHMPKPKGGRRPQEPAGQVDGGGQVGEQDAPESGQLTIVHLYPELLNLYGDGGNVTILAQRSRWRGIDTRVVNVSHGEKIDLQQADIVFLGGGPDREQHLASLELIEQAEELRRYVEDGGVLLAICGGYQILGREWLLGEEEVPGLGLVDVTTKRVEGGSRNRLVGNIALKSPLAQLPVIGYENHAGRTYLGPNLNPFGRVLDGQGNGNNDDDGADGMLYRNVVGTYLHGPLLAKNPEIADWLIGQALERRALKEGRQPEPLAKLDDSVEHAANRAMQAHLGLRH